MQVVIPISSPYPSSVGAQIPALGRQSQFSFQCDPGLMKFEFGV